MIKIGRGQIMETQGDKRETETDRENERGSEIISTNIRQEN